MNEQREIRQQFKSWQEKLTYYIIALCVAAIGFSVHTTSSDHLNWSHLPIGIAVLCWGGSVYCGLRFLKYVISILSDNTIYFDISKGKRPEVTNNPQDIALAKEVIKEKIQSKSTKFFPRLRL